jgi:hypothetical protein
MGYFPATEAAALAGQVVRMSLLVRFDFASQTIRLWQGYGDILAGGETWSGIGELGSISGLQGLAGASAPAVTFMLSGVDPKLLAAAVGTPTEYKDRPVFVFVQFFDEDWATLDNPFPIYHGLMDMMRIQMEDHATRTIEVTSESPFTRRSVVPHGYLSQAWLASKYPGHFGLIQMPLMANKTVQWPTF